MEKIIIFGGCGFLGSWIVRAFFKNALTIQLPKKPHPPKIITFSI